MIEEKYWLCCGSRDYPHGKQSCFEFKEGIKDRVRYGTCSEHGSWMVQEVNREMARRVDMTC